MERWQFCRTTQPPDSIFTLISFSAIAPCPCPKLTLSRLVSLTLLKLLTEMKGSAPGESMNKKGVWGDESGYILFKSKGRDLTN